MNNQFTQRVSDIIMYSKEEANRLRNSYIGPEHLLLGLIREGEGKAIEILFNLQINLQDIKNQLEAIVKNNAENDTHAGLHVQQQHREQDRDEERRFHSRLPALACAQNAQSPPPCESES